MKNKLWLFQLPIIFVFTLAFWITEQGIQGDLRNAFLHDKVFNTVRRVSNFFTDQKFHLRGERAPRNKIVIVEVDSAAIEEHGRWPWHRDKTAKLIDKTFAAGAKVVGLDMVFSEPDQRVPDALAQLLEQEGKGKLIENFETDLDLMKVIAKHRERLVVGWTTENACQPAYVDEESCPVTHPDAIAEHPEGNERFAFSSFHSDAPFEPTKTPLMSLVTFIANTPPFTAQADHSGYFNASVDPDGIIRHTPLFMMANSKPYPSLAMEMARVGQGEELRLHLDERQRVRSLGFAKSGREVPVSPTGVMDINFRGGGYTFTYLPANDVMSDNDEIADVVNRKLAGQSKSEILRDAYVLIGVSALGVFDIRAFPFDTHVPGVEGHANILDNLISGDPLSSNSSGRGWGTWVICFLMIVGAAAFAYAAQRFEAVPALILFIFAFGGFTFADVKFLFTDHNVNWNTGFFYLEMASIFVFTVAAKYVMEERNKKFVKSAFGKYVAPAVVEQIMKDPKKLSLGGEKKELTIMFSDIRSFTSFSEKMDAKALAAFLNEYLTVMTDIVIKNEGTLDKYIGDAIMAFWGAPLDQPDHGAKACRAATEMLQALRQNQQIWKDKYGIDVNIGVGLNSGAVNVGNMGSKSNFAFTVIGDHVNLASRLEGLTKYYGAGALTTRFTLDSIAGAGQPLPKHRVVDHVKVKGRENAVEMVEVISTDMPAEGLRKFEEARALYLAQKWDEATAKFTEASRVISPDGDGVSDMYVERCQFFKTNPPGESWDGSWKMDSK